jgi:hypothetical protein
MPPSSSHWLAGLPLSEMMMSDYSVCQIVQCYLVLRNMVLVLLNIRLERMLDYRVPQYTGSPTCGWVGGGENMYLKV